MTRSWVQARVNSHLEPTPSGCGPVSDKVPVRTGHGFGSLHHVDFVGNPDRNIRTDSFWMIIVFPSHSQQETNDNQDGLVFFSTG